jgi:hypothetical protein
MAALVSLLMVIGLSILITRIAAIALTHTGLSREAARFQARSAYTGVGFTTNEAETVVNHPVRRRIVLVLMLLGNAGIATAITSLVLTFFSPQDGRNALLRISVLAVGLTSLLVLAQSRWIDSRLSTFITWALRKYSNLDVRDYASLLHLAAGYRVSEIRVQREDWMAGKTLGQMRLRDEGVNVLGVQRRSGKYIGALTGESRVEAGDTMVLYGRAALLEALEERRLGINGDIAHNEAVADQKEEVARENPP